ncbi:MAG: hypothetical protein KMY50_06300, partial [Candidatus Desulforudis sp.]|nr:hypothetical protein [Desulforudis sp.]
MPAWISKFLLLRFDPSSFALWHLAMMWYYYGRWDKGVYVVNDILNQILDQLKELGNEVKGQRGELN